MYTRWSPPAAMLLLKLTIPCPRQLPHVKSQRPKRWILWTFMSGLGQSTWPASFLPEPETEEQTSEADERPCARLGHGREINSIQKNIARKMLRAGQGRKP